MNAVQIGLIVSILLNIFLFFRLTFVTAALAMKVSDKK
jgi:hypothetical protein